MKRTNCNEYMTAVKNYLEPMIVEQAAVNGEDATPAPFTWLIAKARRELDHEFQRKGVIEGLTCWLQGLGLWGLDYMYGNIIELAEEWHECKLSGKEEEMVCEEWFRHIAGKIIVLSNKEDSWTTKLE